MSTNHSGTCDHSDGYDTASACKHCQGIIRHEPWCIRMNSFVYYAYEVVLDADKITGEDELRLHSLGVAWSGKICAGDCDADDMNRNLF